MGSTSSRLVTANDPTVSVMRGSDSAPMRANLRGYIYRQQAEKNHMDGRNRTRPWHRGRRLHKRSACRHRISGCVEYAPICLSQTRNRGTASRARLSRRGQEYLDLGAARQVVVVHPRRVEARGGLNEMRCRASVISGPDARSSVAIISHGSSGHKQ